MRRFCIGSTDVPGRLKPEQRHFRHAKSSTGCANDGKAFWILRVNGGSVVSKANTIVRKASPAPAIERPVMRRILNRFLGFARRKWRHVPADCCHQAQLMAEHPQNMESLTVRLKRLDLSQVEFADICEVTPRTVSNWVKGRTRMNSTAWVLLEMLEDSAEARELMCVGERVKGAPRGRPFAPGNPYRFGDRRRAVWVAGAQMARAAA